MGRDIEATRATPSRAPPHYHAVANKDIYADVDATADSHAEADQEAYTHNDTTNAARRRRIACVNFE